MPIKLETVLKKILHIKNETNRQLINQYHRYLIARDTSENHQKHNLKILIKFCEYIDTFSFYDVNSKNIILDFLDKRKKSKEEDPEQRWITTWNDYLGRIKYFFRWLHNFKDDAENIDYWITPEFARIKLKKTKRISPYSENEIWDKDELLTVIKYEPFLRNKAILALMWDLNARPHEITLLRIKNIRLREKYGEGEVPYEAKTGSGPILLTLSFPYVRDWLNEHPYRNESNARLICNLWDGSPIGPDALEKMMKRLKERISRLLENENDNEIINAKEKENLQYLINTKRWNPYCIRHSSITYDSDYLPEYALKKKVRWSMNSRQGSRYIKNRMSNDLKEKILEQNGILDQDEIKKKSYIIYCPRCELVNAIENKYCSKCSYPLKSEAYDEIKIEEDKKFKEMEKRYSVLEEKMENKFQQIISSIDITKLP
jgi:integrase/recombinase XerD